MCQNQTEEVSVGEGKREVNVINDDYLISLQDKYIKLLGKSIDDMAGLAMVHGYKGNDSDYKEGVWLRRQITIAKNAINATRSRADKSV